MYSHPFQVKPRIALDAHVRQTNAYDQAFLRRSRAEREARMNRYIDSVRNAHDAQPDTTPAAPSFLIRVKWALNPDKWPLNVPNRPLCDLRATDEMRA